MVFLKNILNKKNIIWYSILIWILFLITLLLIFGYNMLNDKRLKDINKIEYRSIILDKLDINLIDKSDIESKICNGDDCTIVIKDIDTLDKYVKEFSLLNKDIFYKSYSDEGTILFNVMKLVIIISIIFLLISFIILIFQFIIDDIKTIHLLIIIGYTKFLIFLKYMLSFILYFSGIYLITIFLLLIFNVCSIISCLFFYLITIFMISFIVLIVLIYLFKCKYNKNKFSWY